MNNSAIRQVVNDLINLGVAESSEFKGCSPSEIREVTGGFSVSLPEDYLEFLRTMGKGVPGFLSDVDIFYNSIPSLRKQAELILEDEALCLPDDAFIFAVRQGEQFMFFKAKTSSKVYYYYEEDLDFTVAYLSFSDFLLDELSVIKSTQGESP